ncbi:hypothetical protein PVT68_02500 [Microbulbifer bruguierae]|uniref:Uncharacterized protein n=1 Tax=Microbulbifer bruguierae TaxID=3029061 RepID=A0ABY8NFH3_9GAMM|nr:hypothetical protein [Microbulbifer bruguierae]WGL17180.1 hypothetical protein PVT68_02500 [Microbulbifer bruguierae]
MKIPYKSTALAAVIAALASVPLVWADDMPDVDSTETEVVEMASTVPGDRIAGYFSHFFGSEEESKRIVAGLRDGSIHFVEPVPEGEDVNVEDTELEIPEDLPEMEEGKGGHAGMGYGNVLITMALAEKLAGMYEVEPVEGEVDGEIAPGAEYYVNQILGMRQRDGMGWGNIAKELGVNLGEIVSGIHSNRPEMTEKLARRDSRDAMRAEKHAARDLAHAERAEKGAKVERVAKVDRPEKPMRAEKVERPEKPQRPERPGK